MTVPPASPPFVHLNGRIVPEPEARVSPFDRGFLLGDGVFETMRAYGGRPFEIDAHLARLRGSCALARLPFPDDLPARVDATLRANGLLAEDAAVRVTITRGPGGRGASPAGAGPSTVLVTALPVRIPPETYARGVRLATVRRRRAPPETLEPSLKGTSYLAHVLARIEAEEAGADEALFVDADDLVVEAAQANLFAVMGRRLVTPPLESGCLPGVTRATILRLAPEAGLAPVEAPLPRAALQEADEVMLTSSVTEIAPVVALDGIPLGGGRPGEATRRLHARYRARARGEA